MPLKTWMFLPILLCILFSCRQNTKNADIKRTPIDTNIESTLINLINRFPQLPKAKGRQSDFYRLERSVGIGTTGVELQLRSMPRSASDPQKVIIVINSKQQMYGIPLFSNSYRDYWNFLFDTALTSVQPVQTTFQHELQTCIDTLGLNDTSATGGLVLSEMLRTTLGCRVLYDADSANLINFWYNPDPDLPAEDSDRCRWRFQNIWRSIYEGMHQGYIPCMNALWDIENHRVYQFDFTGWSEEKINVSVKVYRTYCVCYPSNG